MDQVSLINLRDMRNDIRFSAWLHNSTILDMRAMRLAKRRSEKANSTIYVSIDDVSEDPSFLAKTILIPYPQNQ